MNLYSSLSLRQPQFYNSSNYDYTSTTYSTYSSDMIPRNASASIGTGFGENKTFHTTKTVFERWGVPDISEIFYDTLANLRKQGVKVDKIKRPQAFKGKGVQYVPLRRA